MTITIHSNDRNVSYDLLIDHLQRTKPVLTYSYCKSIYLAYSTTEKATYLRSNVAGDIISSVACDVTSFCIKNKVCDPYLVEVELFKQPLSESKKYILDLVKRHNYFGRIYGLDCLSEQIIKEQFTLY